jgi:hypothetical protein
MLRATLDCLSYLELMVFRQLAIENAFSEEAPDDAVEQLYHGVMTGGDAFAHQPDVRIVATTLTRLLTDVPETVLTNRLVEPLVAAAVDVHAAPAAVQRLCRQLPQQQREILERLFRLLAQIVLQSPQQQQALTAKATALSACLSRKDASPVPLQQLIETLIIHQVGVIPLGAVNHHLPLLSNTHSLSSSFFLFSSFLTLPGTRVLQRPRRR